MFFQELRKTEIDLAHLEHNSAAYLNKYRKEVAPKTTLRRLTTLRKFGQVFGMEILKAYNPPTPGVQKPHPLPGGRADLERLLAVANVEWQQILIALTGLCGLRISEARTLPPEAVDLHRRSLKFMGKGDRVREVMCSARAWDIIRVPAMEAMLEDKPSIINCSDKTARYTITMLGRKAGIARPISSHDLRATFATEAYRKSKDIRAVQELLGHANVQQTMVYVLSTDEDQRNAASFADDDYDPDEDL